MADRLKIWTLTGECAAPEVFDKVKALGEETLASLRVRLESEEVLDWPFNFWYVEDGRRIRRRVERLNEVAEDVYVTPTVEHEGRSGKRCRVEDGSHVGSEEAPGPSPGLGFVVSSESVDPESCDPIGSSRVSGVSADCDEIEEGGDPLKSTLVPKEIMDMYLAQVDKLKRDLRDSNLDDHKWEL